MRHDAEPHGSPTPNGESTEQQLRRQVHELQRQLLEQRQAHDAAPSQHWKPSKVTISALALGAVVVLIGAFVAGYIPLQKRDATVRAESRERSDESPRVDVMQVLRSPAQSSLQLPGSLQALTEAPILARTDGYLKRRLVDLGDHVKAGQALAEIDAPELDHQMQQAEAAIAQAQASLEQAVAGLEQAKANRDLARVTAGRWKVLASQGVVSQQDNDQYQAQLVAQNANVQALEKAVVAQRSNVAVNTAALARLQDVQGYRIVKAPFDGVVTQRNVDVGALVTTGTTLLYRIAQEGALRVYVNVPQDNAGSVHVGQSAQLTFSNFPGKRFPGAVKRAANALDPASRTMLVEIEVPNPGGALYPGLYADVDLTSQRANPPLLVPAGSLIVRAAGAQLAEVDADGTVHLRKITVGRDYGDKIEILAGIEEGATIITAPGDAAQDGAKITPVQR